MHTPLLMALVASAAITAPNPRDFGWHTNYDTARAEAKKAGKPMFVVFRCEP